MTRLSLLALSLLLAGCGGSNERPRSTAAAKPEARQVRKYALLVNGDTERRHKRNVVSAYRTLRSLGFEAERMYVLSPKDARVPLPAGARRLAPLPAEFARVMTELAAKVERGDLVLLYGTGHGDSEDGESLLELRRGEVWAQDLADQIGRLRGDVVVIMDQCYSGGFADALEGVKNRVIVVSTVDGAHPTDCTAFARTFWSSFLKPERADANHDGKTSVREAFEAATKAHRRALEGDPELSSNASYRSFNGLADAVLN